MIFSQGKCKNLYLTFETDIRDHMDASSLIHLRWPSLLSFHFSIDSFQIQKKEKKWCTCIFLRYQSKDSVSRPWALMEISWDIHIAGFQGFASNTRNAKDYRCSFFFLPSQQWWLWWWLSPGLVRAVIATTLWHGCRGHCKWIEFDQMFLRFALMTVERGKKE